MTSGVFSQDFHIETSDSSELDVVHGSRALETSISSNSKLSDDVTHPSQQPTEGRDTRLNVYTTL